MKLAFYTLGCKTNQYETQAMERLTAAMGHSVGNFLDDCDAYIINTCSVTAVADKKNRAVIRRCRREHPEAVIAVCGCYSQHDAQAVKALGASVIGGSGQREAFLTRCWMRCAPGRKPKFWMRRCAAGNLKCCLPAV